MKICIITDFLKPQCHGIAIRFEEYIKNLRLLEKKIPNIFNLVKIDIYSYLSFVG
jgi:hypothetical protein